MALAPAVAPGILSSTYATPVNMGRVGCISAEMFRQNPPALPADILKLTGWTKSMIRLPCLRRVSGLETYVSPEPFPPKGTGRDGGAGSTVHLEMLTFWRSDANLHLWALQPCGLHRRTRQRQQRVWFCPHCGQSPMEMKSSHRGCGHPSNFLQLYMRPLLLLLREYQNDTKPSKA